MNDAQEKFYQTLIDQKFENEERVKAERRAEVMKYRNRPHPLGPRRDRRRHTKTGGVGVTTSPSSRRLPSEELVRRAGRNEDAVRRCREQKLCEKSKKEESDGCEG